VGRDQGAFAKGCAEAHPAEKAALAELVKIEPVVRLKLP